MGVNQNRQATLKTLNTKYKSHLQIYTDGSRAEDCSTGAAFCVPEYNVTLCWKLFDNCSIVTAELSAILKSTNWLLKQPHPRKVVILTDSKTSLHLINKRKPKNFTYSSQTIQHNLIKLTEKGWDISLQWLPSHCNISGNDRADKAANIGRVVDGIGFPMELDDLRPMTLEKLHAHWQLHWDIKSSSTPLGLIKKNIGDWPWCRTNDIKLDSIMTGLIPCCHSPIRRSQ